MSQLSIPRLTPFLWYNDNAEQAVEFYLSVFPNGRRLKELRNPGGAPGPKGGIMVIYFELDGQRLAAMNGGPHQKLSEAFSLVVNCATQQEIDYYWERLSEGGSTNVCGWLKDRFGLSWQVTPTNIAELISTPAGMQAMMSMTKFDIAALQSAR